jgi:hypothetical protein
MPSLKTASGGSFGDTQGTGTASFAGATAGGQSVGSAAADSRWQSSYQAHTLGDALNDGVGTVAKRRGGKKQLPRPGEQSAGSPFATGATLFARSNGLVRESENTVHDGTTKNSAHVPGYSGHVPTHDKQVSQLTTKVPSYIRKCSRVMCDMPRNAATASPLLAYFYRLSSSLCAT